MLLHQHDGQTVINPHQWAFFMGLVEAGKSPSAALVREIGEEIDQKLTVNQINDEWDTYLNAEQQTIRHVCMVKVENEFLPENVNEGVGVGWFTIPEAPQLDCTYLTAKDLRKFDVLYRCDSSNK